MTPIGETADSAKHRHQFRAARNQENEFTLIEPPVIRLSNFRTRYRELYASGLWAIAFRPEINRAVAAGGRGTTVRHPTRRFGPASVRGG